MTTYHPDIQSGVSNGAAENNPSDTSQNRFEEGKEQVRDVIEKARVQVGDTATRASDQGAQFIRENPALALGGAVAFGVLLGMAMRGRD